MKSFAPARRRHSFHILIYILLFQLVSNSGLALSRKHTFRGLNEFEDSAAHGLNVSLVEWYDNEYKSYNVTSRVVYPPTNGSSAGDCAAPDGSASCEHHSRCRQHLSYNFSLPLPQRLAGVSYVGHASRLRLLLHRIRQGEAVVVGALGGSITAGHGVGGADHTYTAHLEQWLNAALPPHDPDCQPGGGPVGQQRRTALDTSWLGAAVEASSMDGLNASVGAEGGEAAPAPGGLSPPPRLHAVHNGAVPGTQSSYVAGCLARHLPAAPQLVLLEYAVNDPPAPSPYFEDPGRRALERLIRLLLRLPSRPALLLVNMFAYHLPAPGGRGCCNFWHNAERDFHELALYYGLPAVSLKAAVFTAVRAHTSEALSADAIFNAGRYHPGSGGHVVAAELLITLMQDVIAADARLVASLAERSYGNDTAAAAAAVQAMFEAEAARPLPPPLSAGNSEPGNSTCYVQETFHSLVQQPAEGWSWTDEGRRGKWGFVATEAGRQLRVKVRTSLPGGSQQQGPVLLQLLYLRSYAGMGAARLECAAGCGCGALQVDAHTERHVSLTTTADLLVSQAEECSLLVTTLGPGAAAAGSGSDSSGGEDPTAEGHGAPGSKFKVIGVMVGEETGVEQGVDDSSTRRSSREQSETQSWDGRAQRGPAAQRR